VVNVVDLKKARRARRKRTEPARQRKFFHGKSTGERVGAAVQIIIFFALFAWFMQTCSM
jgi:hypothetical protein